MCIRGWPALTTTAAKVLSHSFLQPPRPASATHAITIIFRSSCSSGPGYRWFILRFIKETGVPLKRDQSATRLEDSASNWPFIKKPSQVDCSTEISRVTTEPHYINYTADEPGARWLTLLCDSRGAGNTHTHTCRFVCMQQNTLELPGAVRKRPRYASQQTKEIRLFIYVVWHWDKHEQTIPLLLYF